MELLTRRTMTVLSIQWLLAAQLVADLAAMTAGFIASMKVWVVVMNCVGCSMLPLVQLAFSASVIAVVAICAVCRCLFGHGSGSGVELKFVDTRDGLG